MKSIGSAFELSYINDYYAKIYLNEIFNFQDRLQNCECFDELYNLCDELLWELECRVPASPELIKELDEIHNEIEKGNYVRFDEL